MFDADVDRPGRESCCSLAKMQLPDDWIGSRTKDSNTLNKYPRIVIGL